MYAYAELHNVKSNDPFIDTKGKIKISIDQGLTTLNLIFTVKRDIVSLNTSPS